MSVCGITVSQARQSGYPRRHAQSVWKGVTMPGNELPRAKKETGSTKLSGSEAPVLFPFQ